MTAKKYIDKGTDPKSIAINIATMVLFILPFLLYFDPEWTTRYLYLTFGLFILAYIVPPMGWRRPHPYSDDPTNRPMFAPKRDE
mmetsp:Transcript_35553/g.82570  ORF Transcript_35553/g.82570 Transcript_35553/m.82570 type:complete len:84 (-) Transcript_35553:642-893(-)|eukprot:CAMPEP_0113310130 /NCGR_PEP_ID=MMETSP0010_2-20120614/7897_1 /TAXON_ID=216773 ORGANISM="Corethron hystrix, Strain 308" /NCGR_SAMPLE_ID=MMETSP0010_2 /ASSEMBLY_ACC=CAM_ASM_000155 /LENGTH=83 /DNA_ID=CAMNT_0000165521 /DNA_START=221 /DNA_END=472 /DNA_ORIENTATION=+ /assembly_acc=CAM_ASM_000155